MRIVSTIEEMRQAVADADSAATEEQRIERLCDVCYCPDIDLGDADPFSPSYRQIVLDVYRDVSQRQSYVLENELAPYLDTADHFISDYYRMGSTRFLGDVLRAMGEVLWQLNLKPGDRLLEYGAGEGGIAIEAAKAGVDVTVVDIEDRYLRLIKSRASSIGVRVETVKGEFGHRVGEYDAVLFYEAFHHAFDHYEVVRQIESMLRPGGRLVLAGEPVVGRHNEQWRPMLPYPWGVRLDGLSFRAVQTYGWMELGFDETYLYEMLMRAGFITTFRQSAATDRGSCYEARPYGDRLDMGKDFAIRAYGRPDEWHDGEGTHRWTAAPEAVLPIRPRHDVLSVGLCNYRPETVEYEVEGGGTVTGRLAFGEQVTLEVPASERLWFRTHVRPGSEADARDLGLAVLSVAC